MTRRERFRLYAEAHFTVTDEPPARSRCRGTVERQTRQARLASLARLTPARPARTPHVQDPSYGS
ncbi:hypothetical protein AB0K51_05100 [Kitasatospora sp. NPDC049285]|uniref:hypothetical protein n=1 Tax=Kitasatospora sp. NPDC049285 TaxID=3157096 RepID=UPI00343D6587